MKDEILEVMKAFEESLDVIKSNFTKDDNLKKLVDDLNSFVEGMQEAISELSDIEQADDEE